MPNAAIFTRSSSGGGRVGVGLRDPRGILEEELAHLAGIVVVENQRVLRSLVWSAWVSGLNSRAYFGSAGAEPQAS
jgi:hypothetical protein